MQRTIPYEQIQRIHCELASRDFWHFCEIKAPNFYNVDYLQEICQAMQEFLTDDNELLIINCPPRFGKSRTAGLFVQWILGQDNTMKVISASYNEKLSQTFSKTARNSIQEEKVDSKRIVYSDIFPDTKIERGSGRVDLWKLERSQEHNYLATSPGSTVTGMGANVLIIDDIVKNAYEANHAGILEGHFEWFTDTLYSRLEGISKTILIMTRWATKDLAGRLATMYGEQGRKYRQITKRAFDGENMLNDKILPLDRYKNLIQTIGDEIVQANYNQMPIDLKGALYSEFMTYKEVPKAGKVYRTAICDPADTGEDNLCMITYDQIGNFVYILDVYYTKSPGNITEKEIPKRLKKFKVPVLHYENNFGGGTFRRILLKECADVDYKLDIIGFTQTRNKQARIFAYASIANKYIYMPEGWKSFWPEFYKEVTEYQREGTNAHDDGCDVLSLIAEKIASKLNPYAK